MKNKPEILMVDDNPADIDLTSEVLAQSKGHFHVNAVNDGVEALSFLQRHGKYAGAPVPDLVVLDLNLPRKDGCAVLSSIKADPALAKIPVVIFTTSQAEADITRSYKLGANCYLKKPGNLPEFVAVVQSMAEFWLGFASLPQREKR
ncbi:MAG TPA: response regulator [Candidatus Sulfotelmatobacter sp.]|nr:response regulator [Candidatus Sulfotelmatobacter sp.]HLM82267.1 response regulator [Terriglobales bacterium]